MVTITPPRCLTFLFSFWMFLFYAGFGDEDLFCFWILFWYFYSMFYSVFISLIYFRIYFCMQWEGESESEVAQLCPTLCNPVDCSPPDFSVHGILQARILEWVAVSFSRGSSQPRDRTQVSCIAGRRFNLWATREAFPSTFLLFLQFSFCYLPQICHTPFISVAVWPT